MPYQNGLRCGSSIQLQLHIQLINSEPPLLRLLVNLVSDNGSPFSSKDFEDFMKVNGIIHHRVHTTISSVVERTCREYSQVTETVIEQRLVVNLLVTLFVQSQKHEERLVTYSFLYINRYPLRHTYVQG